MISCKKREQSFPKSARLLDRHSFESVFGAKVKNACLKKYRGFFSIFWVENTSEVDARIGIAVPKRQIKKAAIRNQVKRVIRESFRAKRISLQGDFVIVAKKSCSELTKKTLRTALDDVWASLEKASTRA